MAAQNGDNADLAPVIRQAYETACRDGYNEAIALAIATRAVLDKKRGLTASQAYDLVVRVVMERRTDGEG